MQLINETGLFNELVSEVFTFYPINQLPGSTSYLESPEIKKLASAISANRKSQVWKLFLDKLHTFDQAVTFCDLTTYTIFSPCFKISMLIKLKKSSFHIRLYISMILPYYYFEVNKIYPDPFQDKDKLLTLNKTEKELLLQKATKAYKEFESNNKTYINEYPEGGQGQMELFLASSFPNYKALPEGVAKMVMPQILTDKHPFGSSSLFELVFTQSKIPD